MNRFLIPMIGFLVIVGFLAIGLKLDPREIPSPLIDKPAPQFEGPRLYPQAGIIKRDDFLGEVWMFNVWASWCVACRQEHPLLNDLSDRNVVRIIGLNYKDKRKDGLGWLARLGNPYEQIVYDLKGDIGIDYGVYGVPETFLIDKKGQIRYKHIGPLDRNAINDIILPTINILRKEQS